MKEYERVPDKPNWSLPLPPPIFIPPQGLPAIYSLEPVKVFYCYAREDKTLRDKLERHLAALKRTRQIITWHDREIQPGAEWEKEIDSHIESADLILLLISADFIDSDYCWGKEMHQALDKHRKGTSHTIPIILRPVIWAGTPIAELQLLPTDAKPVTQWPDPDQAFEDVAQNISRVVSSLQQKVEKEFYKQEEAKSIEYELDYLSKECSKLEDENWELELREYEQTALKETLTKQLDEIARQIQVTEKEIDGIKYNTESLKIRGAQIRAEYDKRARKYQDLTGERAPLLIEWEDPYLIPEIIPGTLPQVRKTSDRHT